MSKTAVLLPVSVGMLTVGEKNLNLLDQETNDRTRCSNASRDSGLGVLLDFLLLLQYPKKLFRSVL
jgi:hypothetical protein